MDARGPLPIFRNPLALVGIVLTTFSAIAFLVVFFADLFGLHANPYVGILFFLIIPAVFLLGLVLIPIGAWLERRRLAAGKAERRLPYVDLNNPTHRLVVGTVFVLTIANVLIVTLAAYRGVEYMDSVQFCGQACHTVMRPEAVAHQAGPHARVACVECHVGSGATSFARSKVSGARRVVAIALNSYARPIPPPQDMRPARETCEQCHWPQKFYGDKTVRIAEYAEDEQNTESVTTLQMRVGGDAARTGTNSGIHWHADPATEIDYVATDATRQTIPYVRVKDASGVVREYTADGITSERLATGEPRRMDCLDCHNRPSHQIAASAARAVNAAMSRSAIPTTLPFVRREAVKLLEASYPSQDVAMESIARGLRDFYRGSYEPVSSTRSPEIEKAVAGIQQIYTQNVFPEMNVRFGTYRNDIGHVDVPGCFRCHDDNHKTKEGKTISQDCETCHMIQ